MYEKNYNLEHHSKNIQWLEFELSNSCQYKNVHTWCPLSKDTRDLIFLKADIVYKVVDYFKQFQFSGRVYLSGYSEPLIDPRLIHLVQYIKSELPNCNIDMFTNGVAADENLLADVLDSGVNLIRLSIYNQNEYNRLKNVVTKLGRPNVVFHPRQFGDESNGENIDERIKVYDNPGSGLKEPCFMPVMYYFVRNNGDVNMCFTDWKYTKVFGNLYVNSVEETLMNEDRLQTIYELVNNNRDAIPVCSGCRLPSQRCIGEYCSRMKL